MMAARLLAALAVLAAADGRDYYAWQGPARGCRGALDSSLAVDCTLPSANLTLRLDRAGSWLQIDCQQNGTLVCAELEEARPLVRRYVVAEEGGRELEQLRVSRCALPAAPLRCLLALLGGADVRRLLLREARGALLPEHVAGLAAVRVLRLDYDKTEGAAIAELPWGVLRALPALRSFSLLGASLRLPPGAGPPLALPGAGPPLALRSLELAAGSLRALPQHAFRSAPNLTDLLLWSNRIEAIHEEAFSGLTQLVNVSLNSNRLTSLPAGLFRDTPRLSRLQLYNNLFAELPEGLFHGLDQLTELELFQNGAPLTLPERLFDGCRSLRVLKLQYARLAALPARLLLGLPLRALLLAGNPLRRLPAELLAGQRALDALDLSDAALEALPAGLLRHAGALRVLRLDRNALTALAETQFVGAAQLQELYLDHNRLQDLHDDTFRGLPRLTTLSLSHNALQLSRERNTLRVSPVALGGAYERDGGDTADDGEHVSPLGALLGLEVLDLSHNRVSLVCSDWRLAMLRLRRLDLSHNELEELTAVDAYFLSNAAVDLSYNRIRRLAPALYGPERARRPRLRLDHNPFLCDCGLYELAEAVRGGALAAELQLEEARCAAPPELRGLALRALAPERLACAAETCPAGCSCRVVPAARALELDCDAPPEGPVPGAGALAVRLRLRGAADLARLPAAVRAVDMSALNLTAAPAGAAGVELDLRHNLLRAPPVELLRRNCSLLLAGNPLDCGCAARGALAELAARRRLVRDYAALRCAAGGALPEDTAALCAARRWAAAGGALAALGLAAAVLTAAAYRYRVELRILLRKLGVRGADDAAPLRYDAFVSFAHEDLRFVAERLVPALERGRRPLRLCVHYRDWRAGDLIPAQIARSVEGSRRTVAVLSRAFLRSPWARLELRAALARQRLVVLLLDGALPAAAGLDPELRAHLALHTYVRADDPLVWERLRDAVLTRRRGLLEPEPPPGPPPGAPPGPPPEPKPGALHARLTADGKLVNATLPAPP